MLTCGGCYERNCPHPPGGRGVICWSRMTSGNVWPDLHQQSPSSKICFRQVCWCWMIPLPNHSLLVVFGPLIHVPMIHFLCSCSHSTGIPCNHGERFSWVPALSLSHSLVCSSPWWSLPIWGIHCVSQTSGMIWDQHSLTTMSACSHNPAKLETSL